MATEQYTRICDYLKAKGWSQAHGKYTSGFMILTKQEAYKIQRKSDTLDGINIYVDEIEVIRGTPKPLTYSERRKLYEMLVRFKEHIGEWPASHEVVGATMRLVNPD